MITANTLTVEQEYRSQHLKNHLNWEH